MMINKRLINMVDESKKYIAINVLFQWFSLIANIIIMLSISKMLQMLYEKNINTHNQMIILFIILFSIAVKLICTIISSRMSFLSSKAVKKKLREQIYNKLLSLGNSYKEQVQTSEIVQIAVEGVEQLETYFGQYLPQFFYAMLSPLTLFIVLSFINLPSAFILLICVPLIPITIIAVQRWAKKLLSKYWGQYTELGDTFLENLQGLTTTKIYQSDAYKHDEMNKQSEHFRRITMKVLTMQLNSITIMDLIAYGGAALGIILATIQFKLGNVTIAGCLAIILLAADFFLPMRMLGSFFHIAMNGMAASDKIFNLLDLETPTPKTGVITDDCTITCNNLKFSYEEGHEILHSINMKFPKGSFTSIVGESGCGKSTLASILMGRNKNYSGNIIIGNLPLSVISEASLMNTITYISHQSYLFKGTVRDNLTMASPTADDSKLWSVLEQVNLAEFLKNENGLDTKLNEKASNLSGGQRQRLALARALLHDSPVYIFDEATSNIDVESENEIMEQIKLLSSTKTIIMISHRLANVVDSDQIYVLDSGYIVERGKHEELLQNKNTYAKLWNAQQDLEKYTQGGIL